jgi:PKD repeat protein
MPYVVASFTATPEYGLNPLLVRFNDSSYGDDYSTADTYYFSSETMFFDGDSFIFTRIGS